MHTFISLYLLAPFPSTSRNPTIPPPPLHPTLLPTHLLPPAYFPTCTPPSYFHVHRPPLPFWRRRWRCQPGHRWRSRSSLRSAGSACRPPTEWPASGWRQRHCRCGTNEDDGKDGDDSDGDDGTERCNSRFHDLQQANSNMRAQENKAARETHIIRQRHWCSSNRWCDCCANTNRAKSPFYFHLQRSQQTAIPKPEMFFLSSWKPRSPSWTEHSKDSNLMGITLTHTHQRGCGWLLVASCPSSMLVSLEWICSDNCTYCHTETEAADQTCSLTKSQYTDIRPTSPSTDPITPGAWQGSLEVPTAYVTGMTPTWKGIHGASRSWTQVFLSPTTRPVRQFTALEHWHRHPNIPYPIFILHLTTHIKNTNTWYTNSLPSSYALPSHHAQTQT